MREKRELCDALFIWVNEINASLLFSFEERKSLRELFSKEEEEEDFISVLLLSFFIFLENSTNVSSRFSLFKFLRRFVIRVSEFRTLGYGKNRKRKTNGFKERKRSQPTTKLEHANSDNASIR